MFHTDILIIMILANHAIDNHGHIRWNRGMKKSSKRTLRAISPRSNRKTRTLDAARLASARGGNADITVAIVSPPNPDMPNQHNETLVRRQIY